MKQQNSKLANTWAIAFCESLSKNPETFITK